MLKIGLFLPIVVLLVGSAFGPIADPNIAGSDNSCPDANTMLSPGDTAVVSDQGSTFELDLRVQPGLNQKIIMSIPPYSYVTIIAGPKCMDNYRWYEVGFQGQSGWSAEVGPDGVYNLTPNFSSALGRDSFLIGIWGGDVNCWINYDAEPKTCHVEFQIQEESGEIYLTDNSLSKRGYTPDIWGHGLFGSYYCFNLYKSGNSNYPMGQECVSPISSNSIGFYRELNWVEASGTLTRVGELTVSPIVSPTTQSSGMGCEPANGKIQFGIINIGPDVFVIFCGERRLVPNPVTLDALGINRNMIDNMRMSDAELTAIPKGPDIPDITRDPAGFQAFKNMYDQAMSNQPAPVVPVPDQSQPDPNLPDQKNPSIPDQIVEFLTKLFGGTTVDAAARCEPQCMVEAGSYRKDLCDGSWITCNSMTDPMEVLTAAKSSNIVRVRGADETPMKNDLIIWTSDIIGNGNTTGHIGVVTAVDKDSISIHDANWKLDCKTRDITISPIPKYLLFISGPNQSSSNSGQTQTPQNSGDKCSQPTGWNVLLCKIHWWNP